MIGVVIVAHSGLATGLKNAVIHVVNDDERLIAVDVDSDDDRKARAAQIEQAANAVDQGDGVVLVTDLHGSSPWNLSLDTCRAAHRRIVYGTNLPMLVQLMKARHKDLESAIDEAMRAGRKYMGSQNLGGE